MTNPLLERICHFCAQNRNIILLVINILQSRIVKLSSRNFVIQKKCAYCTLFNSFPPVKTKIRIL
jgi:hypothetical protein